jgi:hypothetical protein
VRGPAGGPAPGAGRDSAPAGSSPLRALLARDPATWRLTALWAALAMLPDLDLLAGTHNTYTHSVGAVALVLVVAWLVTRGRARLALAAAAAYASHLPLDWLGHDNSAPFGIMALWPITSAYYYAEAEVFMAVSRRYWQGGFWAHNLTAALREMAILLPAVLAVWALRRRGGRGMPRPDEPPPVAWALRQPERDGPAG